MLPLLFALLACPRAPDPAEPPPPDLSLEAPISRGPEAPPDARTPAALYADCRDRVEGPEAAGECKTDADCTRTGCGSEVCTTTAAAPGVMTTCEVRSCFKILDSCGCREGVCSWALKDEVPPLRRLPVPKPEDEVQ